MAFEIDTRSLDSIRQNARKASYPNSEAEAQTVQAIEQEIDSMVRGHEDQLVRQADEVYYQGERTLESGDGLRTELRDLQSALERAGAKAGTDLAKRFVSASNRLAIEIEKLRRIQREAEFHADRVADPYGSLDHIRKTYPQVVAGRRI